MRRRMFLGRGALPAVALGGACLLLGLWAALLLVGGPDGRGAAAAQAGTCEAAGLLPVGDTGLCTHGPDPVPPGEDPALSAAGVSAAAVSSRAVCTGTGTDGRRVQVLYAHRAGTASRLAASLPSLRTWAAEASQIYTDSAARTGGQRYLRFVHDAACAIDVRAVTLSAGAAADFTTMVNELTAKGYGSSARKYLIFLDAGNDRDICGLGTTYPDTSAGAWNTNNSAKGYALIYDGCWHSTRTIAHELAHTFGAVQASAPNATRWWHCTDEWDIMCYDDGSGQPMTVRCPDPTAAGLLDCNHDDYFHTNPPAGSYLATRWNVARSGWLGTSGAPPPTTAPPHDAIGNAIAVGALTWTHETNTLRATAHPSDPTAARDTCWGLFSKTVWYRFVAPAAGDYEIDTVGSSYDTVLGAFAGTPATATRLACNDDLNPAEEIRESRVRLTGVAAGATVHLMVGAYAFDPADREEQAVPGGFLRLTARRLPKLALSPAAGGYGATVPFTVSGFPPNTTLALTFDGGALTAGGVPLTVRTDGGGTARGSFRVPSAVRGDHTVGAAGAGVSASAPFRVTPLLRLSPSRAALGAPVRLALTGFAARETVRVRWRQPDGTYLILPATPDGGAATTAPALGSRGSASLTINVPADAGLGPTTIQVDGATAASSARASFTVADCRLSPTSGRLGTTIAVACGGFAAGETVAVHWDSPTTAAKASPVANADGVIAASFAVPEAAGGEHDVVARGTASGRSLAKTVTVTPFLDLAPSSGPGGASVAARLSGFRPGERICVDWNVTSTSTLRLTCDLVADALGRSPRFAFAVPADATAGTHRIVGLGSGGSRAARLFRVTGPAAAAAPPPPPTPTAAPTATAPPAPTATPEPNPTPTPVPNASPVAVAGPDLPATDEDGDGLVELTLDGSASADPEGAPLTYLWTLADGTPLGGDARLVAAFPVGTHALRLTVTDPAGATATDDVLVVVEPAPPPPEPAPPDPTPPPA